MRGPACCRGLIAGAILATSFFAGEDALGQSGLWAEYVNCCDDAPAGVYETDEFVFFVVEVEITQKEGKRARWEGKAMLDAGSAVSDYIEGRMRKNEQDDPPQKSTTSKSQGKRPDSGLASERRVDNLPTRILVNRAVGTKYRYVVVVNRVDLAKQTNE